MSLAAATSSTSIADAADEIPAFKAGDRILFQGDSITDAQRSRDDGPSPILGHGYVFIIAAKFGAQYPERHLTFLNRGVSGNTVYELAWRWKSDTLDLKPNIVSILIGVNDTAAGMPLDAFEETYDKLLAETRTALPHTRIVLCEPFTLAAGAYKHDSGPWRADVQQRAGVVEKLAAKYRTPCVRFQKAFDAASERAPAEHWLADGIHPTSAGHQLMAGEWIRTVKEFYR